MRLMSASIAATAVITAVRAAIKPRMAAERPAIPSLALESLIDEGGGERARQPDPEHDRQASDLVFQGHPLADQLLARDDQRAHSVGRQRLHMNGLEEPGAGQIRQPSRVVAIGLVGRERLERLVGLPALDAHHRETELAEPVEQDRSHATRLEYDAMTTRRFRQLICDCLRHRRCLTFTNDLAFAVDNADVGLVHRDIEASKIVHRTVSSSKPSPILSAYAEELPPITRC